MAGLPLRVVPIPHPCPNEVYEARMAAAVAEAVADGFTHVAFGDLFLEDVRRYREERLAGTGLEPMFPVWGLPTARLAEEMIETGTAGATLVHRHSRARPPLRRTVVRSIPAGRSARTRRSVRRERRVPHLRERRADVRGRARPRGWATPSRANRSSGPISGCDTHEPLPFPHRLPDRRNDRDAVSAGRRTSRRRCIRLHRATAGGATQAESLRVHQRQVRPDRSAPAGS